MEGVLAIIGVFFGPVIIIGLVLYFRHRSHRTSMDAVSAMVAANHELTPDMVRTLGVRQRPRHADLRTGLVLLAIGLAILIMGVAIPEHESARAGAVIAAFPLLVGAVFVGLWWFVSRRDEA